MIEIISRANGPGPQDARMRRLLQENRGTIARIADHITQGGYSASRNPVATPPRPEGPIIHVLGSPAPVEIRERVRVSPNGRVVVYDEMSGRQLHHAGDVRRREGRDVFVLATAANGYFAPVAEAVATALGDLDGAVVGGDDQGEERLIEEIGRRLAIA